MKKILFICLMFFLVSCEQVKKQKVILQGALAGAVAGCGIGYAIDKGTGLAYGCVGGAIIGGIAANEINKRMKKYATQEEFLDSEIMLAKEYNLEARKRNQLLVKQVSQLQKESKSMSKKYQQGLIERSELVGKQNELKNEIAKNQEFLKTLSTELKVKQIAVKNNTTNATSASESTSNTKEVAQKNQQLSAEIANLEKNIQELQKNIVALSEIAYT